MRERRWARPVFTGRTHLGGKLLVGFLALLGRVSPGARRLGFRFLLRRFALRLRLVLLSLTLSGEVVAASHRAGGLLGLALDVLDDALHSFRRSRLVVRHGLIPPWWRTWSDSRSMPIADAITRRNPALILKTVVCPPSRPGFPRASFAQTCSGFFSPDTKVGLVGQVCA